MTYITNQEAKHDLILKKSFKQDWIWIWLIRLTKSELFWSIGLKVRGLMTLYSVNLFLQVRLKPGFK